MKESADPLDRAEIELSALTSDASNLHRYVVHNDVDFAPLRVDGTGAVNADSGCIYTCDVKEAASLAQTFSKWWKRIKMPSAWDYATVEEWAIKRAAHIQVMRDMRGSSDLHD